MWLFLCLLSLHIQLITALTFNFKPKLSFSRLITAISLQNMGLKYSSDTRTARPPPTQISAPTSHKPRPPRAYFREELLDLLVKCEALSKLSLPLLSIIADYTEQLSSLFPEFAQFAVEFKPGVGCFGKREVVSRSSACDAVRMVVCGSSTAKTSLISQFVQRASGGLPVCVTSAFGMNFCFTSFGVASKGVQLQVCFYGQSFVLTGFVPDLGRFCPGQQSRHEKAVSPAQRHG